MTPPGASAAPPHPGGPLAVLRRLWRVYRELMPYDVRRERLFLASSAFLLTFALVRALTHAIRAHIGPFGNISIGGSHVHHLVWGIFLLLGVGYLWLGELGTRDPASDLVSRLTAIAYGVGAALTLDEFALWLNLRDVYWQHEGRQSVDAVIVATSILLISIWGAPLFRGLMRETIAIRREYRVLRRWRRMQRRAPS
ncbi:MAG: hypothetical protein ACYDGR_06915 [Candidatus Dormibacteria bacterium]